MSQGMKPRDLASLMNEYSRTLGTLVTEHGGLMLGRAGDSAMCVWASKRRPLSLLWPPRRRDQGVTQRRKACRAALEMRHVIERFNSRHSAQPLPTRIGLHAGELALGPVGGEYHVIGDTANAASRIEGLNKHLATTLLTSDVVVKDVPELCIRPMGSFVVPGRTGALRIVEIICGPTRSTSAWRHSVVDSPLPSRLSRTAPGSRPPTPFANWRPTFLPMARPAITSPLQNAGPLSSPRHRQAPSSSTSSSPARRGLKPASTARPSTSSKQRDRQPARRAAGSADGEIGWKPCGERRKCDRSPADVCRLTQHRPRYDNRGVVGCDIDMGPGCV